ncbi:GntR family transcriptional regulator [Paenibacillus donghaensis]|uniref:GntR family transcriptional regulator n=1 Tax=Paenibacillus donghaensis TaxID=414771 RepID=A0A2Z2KH83_9BACL|nr:GntR family transcriptional regulator [Paenibacillus donghaensis]ASA20202.1 GntR family transcriptional regulator [Paenibacillus donghaensis]
MSLKDEIMNELKQDILSLQLKPGTIISETALSERFKLSRTPIRDILKQLSLEDYINIYPKKGNIVSYIDLDSVEQIIYLRSALEKQLFKDLAGQLPLKAVHELNQLLALQEQAIHSDQASQHFLKLDDAFHQTLFRWAGREFLWGLLQQFNVHYVRYRNLCMLKKDKLLDIHKEHQAMVQIILQGETLKIDDSVHHHLRADMDSLDFQEPYSHYIKK